MYMLTRITLILWDYCAALTAEQQRTKILQALTIRRTLSSPIKMAGTWLVPAFLDIKSLQT